MQFGGRICLIDYIHASILTQIPAPFKLPIITATQLNREAYKKNKKLELGADMISESIQKLFNLGFSAVMVKEASENGNGTSGNGMPQKILLKVDKNRDGKTGQTYLYFDYARAKLLTGKSSSSNTTQCWRFNALKRS